MLCSHIEKLAKCIVDELESSINFMASWLNH